MSTSSPATTQRLLSTCRPISENETVAAFETTVDGFVAVLDRVKLDGALNELAERLLPQGGELSSRLHDGGFCILEAHGLGRLAAIERATLAEVVVDEALSAHSRGGAR